MCWHVPLGHPLIVSIHVVKGRKKSFFWPECKSLSLWFQKPCASHLNNGRKPREAQRSRHNLAGQLYHWGFWLSAIGDGFWLGHIPNCPLVLARISNCEAKDALIGKPQWWVIRPVPICARGSDRVRKRMGLSDLLSKPHQVCRRSQSAGLREMLQHFIVLWEWGRYLITGVFYWQKLPGLTNTWNLQQFNSTSVSLW